MQASEPKEGPSWALLEASPDAMLVVDARGRIEFLNARTAQMFGYSREELEREPLERLLPARYRNRHAGHLANYFAALRVRPMGDGLELFGQRKDGQEFPVEIALSPIVSSDVPLVIAAIRDITARKRVEDELRRSREELAITLQSIGDGVIVTDLEGRVTRMNPTAQELTGWSAEAASRRLLEEVFPIFDEATGVPVESPVRRVLRDGLVVGLANHTVLRARGGFERPIADSGAPVRDEAGQVRGVVLVFRDQTEEAAAERRLRKSEEMFRGLLEAAPDAMVVVDAEGHIQWVNAQAEQLFGYAREELTRQAIEVLIPERFRAHHPDHTRRFTAAPRPRPMGACMELAARRKDGSEFPVDVSLSPMSGPDGLLVTAAIRDVTDRDRAENERSAAQRAAEEARAQLEALLDSIPDFVVTLDARGIIQFINRVRGPLERADLLGTSWLSYAPASEHPVLQDALQKVLRTGELATCEVQTIEADGTRAWFASHLGPIRRGQEIVGAVVISRDVTERKRIEAQLVTSERMASMGTLAAGVAHEINNPLASVVANLDLATREVSRLAEHVSLPSDLADELRDARDAAERVRAIVRDLKVFARSEEEKSTAVDLKRVLESTLRIAWNEVRHRARLVKQYGEGPLVEGNESRLGQVFLNLILNAAQSIPEGHAEANELRVSTRADSSGGAVVEIADTGCGMTAEVQRQLFQPFFTTKPAGIGTGLGLAICSRIITGLGGRIEVESTPGRGSTFRVYLRSAHTVAAPLARRCSERVDKRGPAHLLVIDDEPAIGTAIRRAFHGEHEVVSVATAQEALARLTSGERFDVILCDLMMPEMTGMEFHSELERGAPEEVEKVIFLTGGVFTAPAREFLDHVPNLCLEKPFDLAQLRTLVNDRVR